MSFIKPAPFGGWRDARAGAAPTCAGRGRRLQPSNTQDAPRTDLGRGVLWKNLEGRRTGESVMTSDHRRRASASTSEGIGLVYSPVAMQSLSPRPQQPARSPETIRTG